MGSLYAYKRAIIVAMALMFLSSALFSPANYSGRAAAQSAFQNGELSSMDSARTATVLDSKRAGVGRANNAYGKLPLSFEVNRGQADAKAVFVSRGSGSTLFLTADGAVLTLRNRHKKAPVHSAEASPSSVSAIKMKMVGANPASEIVGRERLPGNSNYFRGNDSDKWLSNVPTYARVQYRDLYPGVNLVYYGNQQQLEYDFEIAPGANPGAIKLAFEGVRKISLTTEGDLVLHKAGNEIRMHKPSVYQEVGGAKHSVAGRYVLKGRRRIGFEIGEYDKSRALVIDPVLTYSTFLGGTGSDYGKSIAVDSAGNAYVAGQTSSFNFPVTINGYNTTYANGYDVFVTKLNADGSAIVYSTYLGGNSDDIGYGIAVDSSGNAYVTGSTGSTNYPTTPGAYQPTLHGNAYYNTDAFVTKLNIDGTALVYSTYLGGLSAEQANGIAIDSSGNAYLAGYTSSNDFPTTPGAFQTTISAGTGSSQEAFVTKLNDTATALVYSTFLGGSGADQATAIKVDSSGYAYVTGMTASANFDVTPGAFQSTYAGASFSYYNVYGDGFVTKLNATATGLVYSTYIGGSGDDAGFGIDLADSGEVYLAGSSSSGDFPTTAGVVRVGNGGMAKSTNGAGSWSAANSGVTNSTELSLAIDPANPSTVFVGSSGGGVFKSTNGGANWATVNSGLTDLTIKALTIDPMTTSLMYLGTSNRGVFRSTDSGATWKAINTGQNGMAVNVVKIDPASSPTIYAGTTSGVFKTTNGGASWAAANSGLNQGINVTALAIDPSATSTLYAGLGYYAGGVFKSTNGGATWAGTGLNGASITALALDPSAPSTIYAGTDSGGVQKSTDGGATWNGVNTGLANRSVNALALPPSDPATIYAGTGNGVFKSTNGGTAWNPGNNGLAGAVVNTLAIDPATPLTLYCGSAAGSTDAFVTKLNATGTALLYSTYLGGIGADQATSVATDTSGNAYVTGTTSSQNFPIVRGGFEVFGGYGNDAFVSKLNPTGANLVYSTYLGGSDYDYGYGVAVDSSGSAYVTGSTQSQNFPTTAGALQSVGGGYPSDAFITKMAVLPSRTAELGVTMTASAGPFTSGSSVTYDITVTNSGPERATSIVVTDDLPAQLLFSGCSGAQYPYCSHVGNSVVFTIGSLDVGASINLQISALVSCSIGSSVIIGNTVVVDSWATDSNPSDNLATATITATNSTATLSPPNQFFSSGGGDSYVYVNWSGCSWVSVSNASWITIMYSSNCCNGYVNYTVAPNPSNSRTGTMTVAGQTFTVNQASGCTFSIDHASSNFASAGGTDTVAVTASNASCNWAAFKSDAWITITSGSSGTGNGTVAFSVAINNGAARTGIMTIAGQTFTVNQASGCTFLIDHTSKSFTSQGGTDTVAVSTSDASCAWTASRNDNWITISSGSIGSGNGTVGYSVAANMGPARTGFLNIANNTFTVSQPSVLYRAPFDFDGDLKTDVTIWRPSEGNWWILKSSGGYTIQQWGYSDDKLVPGDYDGDGKTDVAIFRPADGNWWIHNSSNGTYRVQQWGYSSDIPVPGDYDGDGKTDIAVFRPSDHSWWIRNSANGTLKLETNLPGDKPVPGDYDGDGKTDVAVWRASDGVWWILNSSTGTARVQQWGFSQDSLVPADYDGDGKTDFAIWRPADGNWWILYNSGGYRIQQWGYPGDKLVPADYDGDGKTDIAIWRPSDGNWWILNSSGGYRVQQWGFASDISLPSVYVR
ncbi:MAG: SBBP repeat-containing protein [Acidobacteriota bacterium]